jgi:hypothetical protein
LQRMHSTNSQQRLQSAAAKALDRRASLSSAPPPLTRKSSAVITDEMVGGGGSSFAERRGDTNSEKLTSIVEDDDDDDDDVDGGGGDDDGANMNLGKEKGKKAIKSPMEEVEGKKSTELSPTGANMEEELNELPSRGTIHSQLNVKPNRAATRCQICGDKFTWIHRKYRCSRCDLCVCSCCVKDAGETESSTGSAVEKNAVRVCFVCVVKEEASIPTNAPFSSSSSIVLSASSSFSFDYFINKNNKHIYKCSWLSLVLVFPLSFYIQSLSFFLIVYSF